MKRNLLCAVVCLLFCCGDSLLDYQKSVAAWRGSSFSEIKKRLGEPDQTIKDRAGNVTYAYFTEITRKDLGESETQNVVIALPRGQAIGTQVRTAKPTVHETVLSCVTTFEVNKKGIIVDTAANGSCLGNFRLNK